MTNVVEVKITGRVCNYKDATTGIAWQTDVATAEDANRGENGQIPHGIQTPSEIEFDSGYQLKKQENILNIMAVHTNPPDICCLHTCTGATEIELACGDTNLGLMLAER